MKQISLTKGKFALVDDEDFEKLSKYTWCASEASGGMFYAKTGIKIGKKETTITMHRLLMDCPENMEVDHRNGNGLDNQRKNLRICTRFENARNCKIKSFNTSGYKGIYWHKQNKKWVAEITFNLKKINLGSFLTKIDAALAYNKKAVELHREFAKLNTI